MNVISQNADFRRLWIAQMTSQIGSQISYLALPLVAATVLAATPLQMGLLVALDALPALLIGLLAGAFVDRTEKRPVLISADLVRACSLAVIPFAWATGNLSIEFLYAVAMIIGSAALFFDSAYQALLPKLLHGDDLLAGNSAMEVSRSAGELVGPPVAGMLIQVVKAPVALLIDSFSFLASAGIIARIRHRENHAILQIEPETLSSGIRSGLSAIGASSPLRAIAICAGAIGLTNAMVEAISILYLIRTLGLEPGVIGLVFAIVSAGFIIGVLLPASVARRVGIGPALAIGLMLIALGDLLIPVAGSGFWFAVTAVGLGQFLFGAGFTLFNVSIVTLRQSLVPENLMGRVTSSIRTLGWGMAPIGALLGGLFAELIGMRTTLIIAALLEGGVAIVIWRSALWRIRVLPQHAPTA